MFNSLYNKCLNLAAHKSSKYYLAFVSFIESSFFPIPPDVMVIPMVISKRNDFIKIFLIATIFSVLGGILGYFIGAFFFDLGMNIMSFYGYEDKLNNLKNNLIYSEGFYAWLGILFLAGFTPLPYKVFTIASGLIGFNILIFVIISLVSRGLRFFIVSYLSFKFGNLFTQFMEKHGSKWFTIIGIIIVIIGIAIYLILKSYAYLKIETQLNIILTVSLISIISAYFIEYILGHQPCNLCLIERIPYGLSVFFIIFNYIFKKGDKFIILLLILLFIFSSLISVYHLGIEQGFFKESAVCGVKSATEIISKEELLKELQVITISCKDVTFRIFGFSLTTINMVVSFFILIILIKIFMNYEKLKN